MQVCRAGCGIDLLAGFATAVTVSAMASLAASLTEQTLDNLIAVPSQGTVPCAAEACFLDTPLRSIHVCACRGRLVYMLFMQKVPLDPAELHFPGIQPAPNVRLSAITTRYALVCSQCEK
ncbi:hypothetical protein MN608_03969 [Microdochium nivale]|nr:hypothetical protein MN608_03969 [Microdochium nivale]